MQTKNNIQIGFKEMLLIARRQRGLSQRALASLIDRDTQTLHRWEAGDSIPQRFSDLQRIAAVLNIDVDTLDPEGVVRSKCSDFVAA